MNMTASELKNHYKQKKNAKRGGYKPNVSVDVLNKNRIFKIQRLINQLENDYDEHWGLWKQNAEMYEQGYANAVDHIQRQLIEIMRGK